ncbi:carboxymuconolactone decarboxylase family protein [Allopusillimonas ginsengisoli]|uniref:carboxymuconolactone decarboxylase family protein n=1 Tax=Allopusillimonas ginsengisoli TaxID=453575 RepID=UPI0010228981|nr:carboxymuconolactone decarboxylase family protein [Allopusillimonas ginsengisoli]TEA80082.1 carboxymuconolactone decarboxylase family protein [Allopusillimonas ginsengisoli]
MTQRLNYFQASPAPANKFRELSMLLAGSPIAKELQHLVDIRASQLNGCAFCVDMHVKQAKIHGERELRLHHIAVWRESPLFTSRERAALEWTEAVTKLPPHGVPDEIYESVRQAFSEQELAELSFLIVVINGWNRMSVAFRAEPGSMDAAYGLDKAGLN